MPNVPSRPNLALCLLVCCVGAACGQDAATPIETGQGPSSGAGRDGGTAAHADGGAGKGAAGDASSGSVDAAQDAAQDAPRDAPAPGGDAGAAMLDASPGAPASDAGVAALEAGAAKPDAQAADTGAALPTDAGAALPADTGAALPADAGAALPTDAGSQTPDTGSEEPAPDASEPMCVERGASCATGACCADSTCVMDEQTSVARCLVPCEFPTRCDGCGSYCGAEQGSSGLHCREPILLGKDGAYLGRASSSTFAPEGVCNTNSLYGNSYGTYSIHNKNGTYGNTFSQQSPYNPNNFDGPAIACPDEQVTIAYVNKAGSGFNDIDPDELCDWLVRNNFF